MKLFWKLYAVIFCLTSLARAVYFIDQDSSVRFYYDILVSFQPLYTIVFGLNALNLLLNLTASLIVIFYAFDIKYNLSVWRWLFFIRIFTEFTGHQYEGKIIQIGTAEEIRQSSNPVVHQFITGSASGPITDFAQVGRKS